MRSGRCFQVVQAERQAAGEELRARRFVCKNEETPGRPRCSLQGVSDLDLGTHRFRAIGVKASTLRSERVYSLVNKIFLRAQNLDDIQQVHPLKRKCKIRLMS